MTVINTNVSALRAQEGSRQASMMLATASARLSSGKRINSGADDAAGLAVATRMGANIRGATQAIRNANDGISLAQTAEGALSETANILVRLKELAVQSSTGTLTTTDRGSVQTEVTQLLGQVDDIAGRTNFNGTSLLNSASTSINIQTGTKIGENVAIAIGDMTKTGLGVGTIDLSTAAGASSALALIDTATDTVATQRASLGSVQNRLDSTVNNLTSSVTNLSASQSRIQDADYSVETTKLAAAQILSQASQAMLAQANQSQQGVINLLR